MFPSTNKNQSLRLTDFSNSSLGPKPFSRTYTLPRRFKEKFLLSQSSASSLIKSAKSNNLNSNANSPQNKTLTLSKLLDSFNKSIKYLEQILIKKKYELISSISTAILESILDLYNQIKTNYLHEINNIDLNELKKNLNTSLAKFIKWSDSVLFYSSDETSAELDLLIASSNELIKNLSKSVQNLCDFYTTDIPKMNKTRSLSTNSTSTRIEPAHTETQNNKIRIDIKDENYSKTIETKLHSNLVQISTLTKSGANTQSSDVNLDTFLNLDKLALELSELSSDANNNSTFTNDKCSYLLKQFESFAKEFNLKEKLEPCHEQSSSCYSTLNRSNTKTYYTSSSYTSSPSHIKNLKKKTLYKNSEFKHNLNTKIEHLNKLNENLLSKTVEKADKNKTNFLETSFINNPDLCKLLLNKDPVESDIIDSSIDQNKELNPNLDMNSTSVDLNNLNSFDLKPGFLLIDDDDDDDDDEDADVEINDADYQDQNLNDNDILIIVEQNEPVNAKANLASFSSESLSNSSLSLSNDKQTMTPKKELKIDTSLNIQESNKSAQSSLNSLNLPSPVQGLLNPVNQGLQSESSLSDSSHISNSSYMSPKNNQLNSINILSLLDVTHLLEYQSSSSISSSSLANTNVNIPNSSILRGGHVDALIVLATSASSSVIAAPAQLNNNNSTHSLTSSSSNNNNSNPNLKDKTNFLFQEAFLTTYRTILQPIDLINKLIYRYRIFSKKNQDNDDSSNANNKRINSNNNDDCFDDFNEKFDLNRLKMNLKLNKMKSSAVRNSLTLLIRVLDGLNMVEMDDKNLIDLLNGFVTELLIDDELQMARLMRKKLLFKLEKRKIEKQKIDIESLKNCKIFMNDNNKIANESKPQVINYINSFSKRSQSILDFKSIDIAEQMTLIDLNLFNKIELCEVLLWSTKQNEQTSPNLIKFTEHFNNISYWARSRILEPENYKDRERYLIKFLKIMKHLRKMNNFNSYLSILSAVDSGPIQRLDWPKNIIDTIKEFSTLIDPKCGFKSLREAISEAQPPCIPHIGLILQDLTILHIANPDYLPSGNCNFWKRWQQFNILERLRYFKRCNYNFKSNIKIQELFNDFQDYIGEDAQYSLSEQLKPRIKNGK